jgi:hypothetical protein
MTFPQNTDAHSAKPGLVAIGRDDASAARSAGIEAWELADAWAWLDLGDSARAQIRSQDGANPDSPIDPALKAWAKGRVVVVPELAGWSAQEKKTMKTLARALRVQTAAASVVHTVWGK